MGDEQRLKIIIGRTKDDATTLFYYSDEVDLTGFTSTEKSQVDEIIRKGYGKYLTVYHVEEIIDRSTKTTTKLINKMLKNNILKFDLVEKNKKRYWLYYIRDEIYGEASTVQLYGLK